MLSAHDNYQYKPFVGSSHLWAQEKLSNIPNSAKVLDVGAGSGFLGKFLKSKGVSDLYAVEIDPETSKILKETYKEVVSNINELKGEKFDVVVLLDILEHLPRPKEFINQLKEYLSENAIILISVPNIAHWSVRIPLLFGCFNYKHRGILDETHLWFFTRKTFKKFISETSLKKIELSQTIVPLEFVLPKYFYDNILFRFYTKIRVASAKLLPGLFAFQHLALLQAIPKGQIEKETT